MKKLLNKKSYKKLIPWIFLLPSIIILVIFLIIPIVEAFRWSVMDYQIIANTGEYVGLNNFIDIFKDEMFIRSIGNTFLYVLIVLPINIFVPIILASLVNQKLKSVGLFRVLYYIPVVTPIVVSTLMWKMLYSQSSIISTILVKIGVLDSGMNFLTNSKTAIVAVALITAWRGLGYYMVMYLANLQSIPEQLYESASIDGANAIDKFTKITIPMVMPTMTLVSLLTIINGLKVFAEINLTTGGGPAGATTTMVMYIYKHFNDLDVSTASAAGIILLIFAMVFSFIQRKLTGQREEDLKG